MEIDTREKNVSGIWQTTVKKVISIFRDALIALAPALDKAHIPYGDYEQYDDFDAIAEVLYEQIVLNSIKGDFSNNDSILEIPAYGFSFVSERHTAFIEVSLNTEANEKHYCVFRSFSSNENLFDAVFCGLLNKGSGIVSEETKYFPFTECSFQLRHREKNTIMCKSVLEVLL